MRIVHLVYRGTVCLPCGEPKVNSKWRTIFRSEREGTDSSVSHAKEVGEKGLSRDFISYKPPPPTSISTTTTQVMRTRDRWLESKEREERRRKKHENSKPMERRERGRREDKTRLSAQR